MSEYTKIEKTVPQSEHLQIVNDAISGGINEMSKLIKERATEALYTHYKAIQDKRKYCSIHGRNFNADSEGMAMALEFRQLLSFTRLILNDKDFFTDQMDIEI